MEHKTAFDEKLRQNVLSDYHISKTDSNDDFDQLTQLALQFVVLQLLL